MGNDKGGTRAANRFLSVFVLAVAVFALTGESATGQAITDVIDRPVSLERAATKQIGKRRETIFSSAQVDVPFTGVAIQGYAEGTELEARIRFFTEGKWTPWEPMFVVRSATDPTFLAAYRNGKATNANRFEVALETDDPALPEIIGSGVFDGNADADTQEFGGHYPELAPDIYPGLIIPPLLHRRPEWGAEPFRGNPIPLARPDYRYITFHHAAGFGAKDYDEGLQQVNAIQTFHQDGRGWSDIGYHFVLDEAGNLFQGRPFLDESLALEDVPPLAQGAHAGGANTGNIGVCVLGCYHPDWADWCDDVLSDTTLDSLVTTFGFLADAYGIPPENIRGHRDFGNTSCPGDNNYTLLPEIRQRVQQLILTGNQPLGRAQLAVEVTDAGVVSLNWEITQDNGIAAFRVDRVYPDTAMTIVQGLEPGMRSWVDAATDQTGALAYRLYATNLEGLDYFLGAVEVNIGTPADYVLSQAFPNPFSSQATVRYYLRQEGYVRATVHDAAGRAVADLVDAFQESGRWYHAKISGTSLSSGTYFIRLEVEGYGGIVFEETIPVLHVR